MKAVYVGAGLDTRPIEHFKEIKLFYYIDGQPNSEFGILQSEIIMNPLTYTLILLRVQNIHLVKLIISEIVFILINS